MADKFYSFIGNNRAYVGELTGSNSKMSALIYHFNRCLPGKTDFKENTEEHDAALERMLFSYLKENGGKNSINSITDVIENDADTVIGAIKTSLDNYVFSHFNNQNCPYNKQTYKQGDFYSDIEKYFGRGASNAYIRVPEMLLILLRSKEFPMGNTHANYGPRNTYVNGIENYINAKVLHQREEDSQRLKPYLMLTFDIERLPDQISDSIQTLLGRKKRSINKTSGHDQIAIDILKNPDFIKVVNKVVRDTTIKSVRKQLSDFINKALPQNENWQTKQVRNDIIKFIDELDTYKGKRYSTLVKAINEATSKYKEIDFKPTDFKTFDNFSKFLIGGLNSVSFSNFMKGKISMIQELHNGYKNAFATYIQKVCFHGEANLDYQDGKKERIITGEGRTPLRPGALYPSYLKSISEGLVDNQSFKEKTYLLMEQTNNSDFILNNGSLIYPEQVACYLTSKKLNFDIEFYPGFITEETIQDITIY